MTYSTRKCSLSQRYGGFVASFKAILPELMFFCPMFFSVFFSAVRKQTGNSTVAQQSHGLPQPVSTTRTLVYDLFKVKNTYPVAS